MKLKYLYFLCLAVAGIACGEVKEVPATREVPTAGIFDIKKMMGRWYEIASIPVNANKKWNHNYVIYSMNKTGGIDLQFYGLNTEGKTQKITQSAVIKNPKRPDLWTTTGKGVFKNELHVLFIDKPRYEFVMVSDGTQDHVWILSKKPYLEESIYRLLFRKAELWSYDVSKLEKINQDPIAKSKQ